MTDQAIKIPPAIESSTPATKLVYIVLDNEGPLTQRELIDSAGLSRSTVHDVLGRLEERDLVVERHDHGDVRHHVYKTT